MQVFCCENALFLHIKWWWLSSPLNHCTKLLTKAIICRMLHNPLGVDYVLDAVK